MKKVSSLLNKLKVESALVKENSMKVLREFDSLEVIESNLAFNFKNISNNKRR